MWSDPDEVDTWAVSPRGAGWLFGGAVTKEVRYIISGPYIIYLRFAHGLLLLSLITSTPCVSLLELINWFKRVSSICSTKSS